MAEVGRRKGEEPLIAALAAGHTLRDAARTAHVSERTAGRCWAEPAFRDRVTAARDDLAQRAAAQLADAAGDAVATLKGLLTAPSASVQLQAAKAILELGAKLREGAELFGRLQRLEEEIRKPRPPGGRR